MQERRKQFGSHVAKKRLFSVGYMKGSMKVSIRIPADMSDVGQHVSRGENMIMWCEGVEHCDSSDSEEEIHNRRKKRKKVSALEENVLKKLSEIFARSTTIGTLQFNRLWSEMIDIGTHR